MDSGDGDGHAGNGNEFRKQQKADMDVRREGSRSKGAALNDRL